MELIKKSKVLVDEKTLDNRLTEIAYEINRDYAGEKVIVVGVLKGAFMFMSDLLKKINLDTEVYFLKAESYGSRTESSGTVKITKDIECNSGHKCSNSERKLSSAIFVRQALTQGWN